MNSYERTYNTFRGPPSPFWVQVGSRTRSWFAATDTASRVVEEGNEEPSLII